MNETGLKALRDITTWNKELEKGQSQPKKTCGHTHETSLHPLQKNPIPSADAAVCRPGQ